MDSLATKPYHQTEGKVCKGIASHTDCFVMCDCVIVKIIGPPCVYFIFSSINYHFPRIYQCSLCVSIPFIGRFIVLTPSPPAICHYLLLLLLCPHIIHLSLCFSSPSVFRSPNIFFLSCGFQCKDLKIMLCTSFQSVSFSVLASLPQLLI